MKPKLSQIKQAMKAKGFTVFGSGEYNLNLVGIRTDDSESNRFNDWFCVFYNANGTEHYHVFECTTDPGLYWRLNPMNVNGTAILVEGQHWGMWEIGRHQGRYEALVQVRPVPVYRDNNKDAVLDCDTTERGLFGINGHRANAKRESIQVDKWSAGCQVIADPVDYDLFMALANKGAANFGNSFTYTLLKESDLCS